MNPEIKNRFTREIIIPAGKYADIKEAVEKNGAYLVDANLKDAYLDGANLENANLKDAYLYGANLENANLKGAYLYGANLENANLDGANLKGANLDGANLDGANLNSANLYSANLYGANLKGANLDGAYLKGAYLDSANLDGAKYYVNSHDIFMEVCKRQKSDVFTLEEWGIIGIITIHRLCWDAIQERFGDKICNIFKILADAGFDEWKAYYDKLLKEEK